MPCPWCSVVQTWSRPSAASTRRAIRMGQPVLSMHCLQGYNRPADSPTPRTAMTATAAPKRPVLIVDDDHLLLQFLGEILRHAGYDTVEAPSAELALKHVEMREPDLALLDITMPGMNGLDLARRLHDTTNVPFMFLSASG